MQLRGLLFLKGFILVFAFLYLLTPATYADIGVGVGTGKINIDEPIKSGSIYTLPQIIVYNTGDETATYSMQLTLNETQEELKPNPEWFSFSPQGFELEPGKSMLVTPTLQPPLSTPEGSYFGYLEAYPDSTVEGEGAAIGVAAATKLSFEVTSSSLPMAVFNRIKALIIKYSPWTYLFAIAILLFALLMLVRKYIRVDVSFSRSKKDKSKNDKEEDS